MYSLVLGSGGLDSTGFLILMETLHNLWPKGRHVAIIPQHSCPWVGTASNIARGVMPEVEYSVETKKDKGWKDVYTSNCTPVDAMYYGVNHSSDLLGFANPFDLVISGIHHGEVLGLDALHSSAVVAVGICSRTYGIPGLCIAQQMDKPTYGDIDRKNFYTSERLLGNLLTSLTPAPGECLIINVPTGTPVSPKNAILADYQPRFPAKASPYFKGPETDIAVLQNNYVSVAEFSISINSPVRL